MAKKLSMLKILADPTIRKVRLKKLLQKSVSGQDVVDLFNNHSGKASFIGGSLSGYGINELLNNEEELPEDELLMEILANSN